MFSKTLRPEPQAGLTAGSRAEPRPGGREGRIPRRWARRPPAQHPRPAPRCPCSATPQLEPL